MTKTSRRRTTALVAAGALVLVLCAGALFGGVLTELRPAAASVDASPRLDAEPLLTGLGSGRNTMATIAALERQLASRPADADSLGTLGLAYQVRWRETGDPTFLPLSGRALREALSERPHDATSTLGLGNLALIRHRFRTALALGREARRLAPFAARPYGVVGDALVELGRYREAFATFDRMVATKPSVASYARGAYARELRGDRAGAVVAMQLALDAAGGTPEPTAWAHVELAKLALGDGRLGDAARNVRAALAVSPGYVLALEQPRRRDRSPGGDRRAASPARRLARRPPRAPGSDRRRCEAARDGRGDRPAAGGERPPRGSRVGGIPRRPSDPAGRDGATRPRRAGRPALDLRGRRARLGACPRWPLPGGRAMAGPRPPARDE